MVDLKAHAALLQELEQENERIQVEVDRLMGEMESVPAEQRDPMQWGERGTLTLLFIELSERQNEIAEQVKLINRAMDQAAPPKAAD